MGIDRYDRTIPVMTSRQRNPIIWKLSKPLKVGLNGMAVTIIIESYNFDSGQSWDRFVSSMDAAIEGAEQFDDGSGERSNAILVLDPTSDPRIDDLVDTRRSSTRVPIRLRRFAHGSSYDRMKDIGAVEASTSLIAYLDGDCAPVGTSAAWLDSLHHAITGSGAPGVSGTTVYEGDSIVRLACSAMDFGFLLQNTDGSLTAYASNNVMFMRESRAENLSEVDGLRCACYLHAQRFLRSGTPMRHASSKDALVAHEFPPLGEERFRRGYDAVAVAWNDPTVFEAKCFKGPRIVCATLGVARYLVSSFRLDSLALMRLRRYRRVPWFKTLAAILLLPILRGIDIVGIWRALLLGPDAKWSEGSR